MAVDPINYNDLRFDAQGRPFYVTQSGKPSYLSPGMAAQAAHLFVTDPQQRAAVNAGMSPETLQKLIAYAQQGGVTGQNPYGNVPRNTFTSQNNGWNPQTGRYDTGMNWGGLGGAILGGAGLAGPLVIGPAIAGAAGGGAAAGGAASGASAAADGTIPFTTAPGVSAAAASGAVGPSAGLGASAPLGSLTAGAGAGAGVGGGAAAASGFADKLKAGLSNPSNLASLAGLVTSLAGGSGGGGNGQTNADLARAQAITEARMRRVDPLHQAITNLAMSRLPTNMQRPVPDVPLPGVK